MTGGVVFGIRFKNFHMISVTAGNTLLVYSDIEMDDSQDLSDVLGHTNGCQDPANKRYHTSTQNEVCIGNAWTENRPSSHCGNSTICN